MKTIQIFLVLILFTGWLGVIHSCSDDDQENPDGNNQNDDPQEATVNNAVISLEEIYTAPEEQIETRSQPLFVAHNDKIYVFGFDYDVDQGGAYSKIWEYTPQTNSYIQKANGCGGCSGQGYSLEFFSDGNLIYHIDTVNEPQFEFFNPAVNQWGIIDTPIPNGIGRFTEVLTIQQKAYFLGGIRNNTEWEEMNSFTYFNTQTAQWVNLAPYPDRVYGPIMVHDGENYIYAIGGGAVSDEGTGEEIYTFARYSISQNQWEPLPDLPHVMISDYNGRKAQILHERFIVVANFFDHSIHIYDIEEEIWMEESFALGFSPQAILKSGNKLYVAETVNHNGSYSHKFYELTVENLPS